MRLQHKTNARFSAQSMLTVKIYFAVLPSGPVIDN